LVQTDGRNEYDLIKKITHNYIKATGALGTPKTKDAWVICDLSSPMLLKSYFTTYFNFNKMGSGDTKQYYLTYKSNPFAAYSVSAFNVKFDEVKNLDSYIMQYTGAAALFPAGGSKDYWLFSDKTPKAGTTMQIGR
jgi:hypothetical protein